MTMEINDYIALCHAIAKEKGWWNKGDRNKGELIALMHSELSEALEELRANKEEISELADVLIRIFDYCGYYKLDLQKAVNLKIKKNKERPYRHGKEF